MKKLRVGVVGMNRGNAHCRSIVKSERYELVAVCDTDLSKAKARAEEYSKQVGYEIAYYGECRELCERSDIDAVIMATPIDVHDETVITALDSGKHVLSEVITATTLDGIRAIGEAIKRSCRIYMMAENYCYIRPLLIVEEMVKRGMFGEIYYAESDYLKDFQVYNPSFPNIGGWRQSTYFGRRGHPYITHTLGPLLHIMNERVAEVSCMAAGHSFDMVADNTCTLMLKTDGGHLVRLRSSFVSPRPDNFIYYSFQGTKGCYQAPQGPTDFHKVHIRGLCKPNEWKNVYEFEEFIPEAFKRYFKPDSYTPETLDSDSYALFDSGILIMLEEFAACVLDGAKNPVTFEDSANWTAAGLLSADSVNAGCMPISIPEF